MSGVLTKFRSYADLTKADQRLRPATRTAGRQQKVMASLIRHLRINAYSLFKNKKELFFFYFALLPGIDTPDIDMLLSVWYLLHVKVMFCISLKK